MSFPCVASAAERAGIEYRRQDYHTERAQSRRMAALEWERPRGWRTAFNVVRFAALTVLCVAGCFGLFAALEGAAELMGGMFQ